MTVYHPSGWEQYGGWIFGLMFLSTVGYGIWLMWMTWRTGRA